jgi:signal transduction histidine kinase
VVSHDLRGPLQTIVLSCDLLRRDQSSPRIDAIHRAAIRATALVNDLLDATRARLAGILSVEIVECDLVEVIREALDETRVLYPNRTLDAQLPASAVAQADPRRIAQLVTNLVGNAVQHSAATSPVRITLAQRDGGHELSVHNAGTIPSVVRQRMFEPLERDGDEGTGHNIGLGLYIVSEIVRAHGGAISVDSDPGRGTTFSVHLPS